MTPLPTGPLSPQEEADWRDIARAHRDGTSMTSRFFATLDAARAERDELLAIVRGDGPDLSIELAALRALADAVGEADIGDPESLERVGRELAAVRAAQGKP